MLINVLDYDSIAEALTQASVGDRIYIPGDRQYMAPPGGWRITKSLEIFGDGPGSPSTPSGTVLTPSDQGPERDVLVLEAGMTHESGTDPQKFVGPVYIHDLRITRRLGQTGVDGRDGIRFRPERTKRLLAEVSIERVAFSHLGGAGVRLEGFNGGDAAVAAFLIADVEVVACGDVGVSLAFGTTGHVARARVSGNAKEGLSAFTTEVALYSCVFDGNRAEAGTAEVSLVLCNVATIESCRFSNFGVQHPPPNDTPPTGVILDRCGGAAVLRSNVFDLGTPSLNSIGAELRGAAPLPGGPCLILANRFTRVNTGVKIQNLLRYAIVHPQFCQNVAIPLVLPTGIDDAPIGCPMVRSAESSQLAGFLLPRFPAPPGSNTEPGTLAYMKVDPVDPQSPYVFQALIGDPPVWRRIRVSVDTCGQIGNCHFVGTDPQVECSGIVLSGTQCGPFVIMGNRFNNIMNMIVLTSGVTGCAFYPQYDESTVGEIVIPEGNGGSYGAPHVVRYSEFEVRGLQLPVVDADPSAAQSIEGMLVFSTVSGVRVYTAQGWRSVVTGAP